MWLVLRLCTPVQKGRVGRKNPSHFLLQLQNRPTSFLTFFVKGVWLSLHIRFVNTGSVLPPTTRVTFPTWLHHAWSQRCRVSARRAFVVKNNIIFISFRKWAIVSLDKTLIPQLGSCRALWSCIETAIWTFNPLMPTEVHYMEKKFPPNAKFLIV